MLCIDNIKFECECQGFKATNIQISDDQEQSAIFFESTHWSIFEKEKNSAGLSYGKLTGTTVLLKAFSKLKASFVA